MLQSGESVRLKNAIQLAFGSAKCSLTGMKLPFTIACRKLSADGLGKGNVPVNIS